MSLEKLIQMVVNLVLKRLVNLGVTKGIDLVAGKGKPGAKMIPEERDQAKGLRETVKRARQAAQITRRLR